MDRRCFLFAVGGTLSWPRSIEATALELQSGGQVDDEAFWAQVRSRFLIPPDRIYLNNGTLGPSPSVVVEAVHEHTRRVAATYPPGVSWDDLKGSISSLIGGDSEGFVFPRNTTEAMSFVANGLNGLEVDPEAEVLTTDHEHIGGLEPWRLLSARRGPRLVVATLPPTADSSEELLEAVWSRVTGATRVMSVSHVTFTNGTALPVRELAARSAEQGIVLVVDGAHPPGMIRLDLGELGGDFSPRWREALWPTLASGGWDDKALGAHRLNHLGTFDESRMAGLLAAVEFLQAIGMERVEARVRYLRRLLQDGLEEIPGVFVTTPGAEELATGMVAFRMEGVDSLDLQAHLARTERVRTRVISEYGHGTMRLSTHIYNRPDELHRVLGLLRDAARTGVPTRGGAET
jgi:selenocysteine lyase/cysteine desulfurase